MIVDDLMILTVVAGLALSCVHLIVGYNEWRRNAKQQQQRSFNLRALYGRPRIDQE